MKTKTLALAASVLTAVSYFIPAGASAQGVYGLTSQSTGDASTLGGLFSLVLTDLNTYVVPLIFAIAFIVFLWGVFQYFIAGGADEGKRADGRNFILYGIIGFVIMFSLWGIVNILIGTFPGLSGKNTPQLPTFQTTST